MYDKDFFVGHSQKMTTEEKKKRGFPFELRGYEYVKPLGEGSEGTVALAINTATRQQVAVKYSQDRNGIGYEVIALETLGYHPNIIHMRDYGIEGTYAYVILDYHWGDYYTWLQGTFCDKPGSLKKKWAEEEKHPILLNKEEIIKRFALHLARALDHMQSLGWIHRDVKPENSGIAFPNSPDDPQFLLCDFGGARKITDNDGILIKAELRTFGVLMTPPYASPRTNLLYPQYYVDDAGALVFSIGYCAFLLPNLELFTSPIPKTMATEKFAFLQNPVVYLARKKAMILMKVLPAWYLHLIILVSEELRRSTERPFPYQDAVSLIKVTEDTSADRKRKLGPENNAEQFSSAHPLARNR